MPAHTGAHEARDVIDRFVAACGADDRIVAAFLHGSRARDAADEFSDVDLAAIATDEARDDVWADRVELINRLGRPLFVEDFGSDDTCFFILDDGTEGELSIGREGALQRLHVGPFRPLLDESGILADVTFPPHPLDEEAQREAVRRLLFWFWHELQHLTTALGRGQLWWAMGQLESIRGMCVSLARAGRGQPVEDEPYWKLDLEQAVEDLGELRSTFVPMEREAMLRAAGEIVAFFHQRAPRVGRDLGVEYPGALAGLLTDRFEALRGSDLPD